MAFATRILRWPSTQRILGLPATLGARLNSTLMSAALQEAESSSKQLSQTSTAAAQTNQFTVLRLRGSTFRQSPKKSNLVAKVTRNLELNYAIDQMAFSPKRAATNVAKVLKQARRIIQDRDKEQGVWIIKQCFVGKGNYLKRMKLHARGRFGIMHHPSSHVTVILHRVKGIYTGRIGGPSSNPLFVQQQQDPLLLRKTREMETLRHIFKRHNLYAPFVQAKPRFLNPVWSRKSWKYVTSPKWLNPKP